MRHEKNSGGALQYILCIDKRSKETKKVIKVICVFIGSITYFYCHSDVFCRDMTKCHLYEPAEFTLYTGVSFTNKSSRSVGLDSEKRFFGEKMRKEAKKKKKRKKKTNRHFTIK